MPTERLQLTAHLDQDWEVTTEEPRKRPLWLLRGEFILEEEVCGGQNIQGQVYI